MAGRRLVRHGRPRAAAVKRLACPHCGPRDLAEFTYGGPATLVRPDASCDDATWTDYLFMRDNPRGAHDERWCHTYGCGLWLRVLRDTRDHRVLAVHEVAHG